MSLFLISMESLWGIFGLTFNSKRQDYITYDYELPERYNVVKKALDKLKRQGACVIIALTHQDFEEDKRLVTDFPDIDIIIGGHDQFYIKEHIGHTWITKADADAKSAIVYDLRMSPNTLIEATPHKVDLNQNIEKDPIIDKKVDYWKDKFSKTFKERGTRQDKGQARSSGDRSS